MSFKKSIVFTVILLTLCIYQITPTFSGLASNADKYKSGVFLDSGLYDSKGGNWLNLNLSGVSDKEIFGSTILVYQPGDYLNVDAKLLCKREIPSNINSESGFLLNTNFEFGNFDFLDVLVTLKTEKTIIFRDVKANQCLDLNLVSGIAKPIIAETTRSQLSKTAIKKPNIVFILTDDLDKQLDTMKYMPKINSLIKDQGVEFEDFFVSLSLCCPSRSTILRGQFVHNHQTYTNGPPNGGFDKFYQIGNENSTMATWLSDAGYRTALFGKYLNGYPYTDDVTHIPPGWTEWFGACGGNPYSDYNYDLNENGKVVHYAQEPHDYMTDVISNKADDFIRRSVSNDKPFFTYISPYVPHSPSTVALRHKDLLPDLKAPRLPNFNEEDVSDKPQKIKTSPKLDKKKIAQIDADYRKRILCMLPVDEMVERLYKTLEELDQLDNTYIIFTSDNGFHMGNHRLFEGKATQYDTDLYVPLYIRGPGIKPGSTVKNYISGNVDFAPTFAEIAGIAPPDFVDGRSLVPLWSGQSVDKWRQGFLLEQYAFARGEGSGKRKKPDETIEPVDPGETQGDVVPSFTGLRLQNTKYIELQNGEVEYYDLAKDPYELDNLAKTADKKVLSDLSEWLKALQLTKSEQLRQKEENPNSKPPSQEPEVSKPYKIYKDIIYKETENPALTSLDVYTPDVKGNLPVFVWIHGGAWRIGDKSGIVSNEKDMPAVFCKAGYVVISVNYRLSPKVQFPVHVQDVASAIAWVKSNIKSYGGDPTRINVSGHSAGAHLSALISTDEQYLKQVGLSFADIKTAIPVDAGTYDFVSLAKRLNNKMPKNFIEVFTNDPKVWKEASPIHQVEEGEKIPPMLVLYSKGVTDKENPNYKLDPEEFVKKLNDKGHQASIHGAPEKTHSEIAQALSDSEDHVTKAILDFLSKHNIAKSQVDVTLKFVIGNTSFELDGKSVQMDVSPTIINGKAFLPAKYMVEPLGGVVSWDSKDKKVTCKLDSNIVEMWLGNPQAKINGKNAQIDPTDPNIVPIVSGGRTMVPFRFLAESLSCQVQWIDEAKTIILTYTRPSRYLITLSCEII